MFLPRRIAQRRAEPGPRPGTVPAVGGGPGRERSWPQSWPRPGPGCWAESGVARAVAADAAIPTMGQIVMAPTVATTQAADVKNAVRMFGAFGALLGLMLGLAGGWSRGNARAAWAAGASRPDRGRSDRGRRPADRRPGLLTAGRAKARMN